MPSLASSKDADADVCVWRVCNMGCAVSNGRKRLIEGWEMNQSSRRALDDPAQYAQHCGFDSHLTPAAFPAFWGASDAPELRLRKPQTAKASAGRGAWTRDAEWPDSCPSLGSLAANYQSVSRNGKRRCSAFGSWQIRDFEIKLSGPGGCSSSRPASGERPVLLRNRRQSLFCRLNIRVPRHEAPSTSLHPKPLLSTSDSIFLCRTPNRRIADGCSSISQHPI